MGILSAEHCIRMGKYMGLRSQVVWFPTVERSLTIMNTPLASSDRLEHVQSPNHLFWLDLDLDGVEQITETLSLHDQLTSLHLVFQEGETALKLGTTVLQQKSLDKYGWQFQQWGEALATGATIVLHGLSETFEADQPVLQQWGLLVGASVVLAHKNASGSTGSPLRRTSK